MSRDGGGGVTGTTNIFFYDFGKKYLSLEVCIPLIKTYFRT